jgi:O-antigen ligase
MWNVIGISYSENAEAALNLAFRKVHLIVIPLGFILLDERKFQFHVRDIVLSTFLVGCLLASFVCLGNAVVNMLKAESTWFMFGTHRQFYFTSHALSSPLQLSAVYLSMYANLALLVALVGDVIRSSTVKRMLAIYLLFFIVLCGSSAGILAATLTIILWQIKTGKRKVMFLTLLVFTISFLTAVFLGGERFKETIFASFKFTYTKENGELSDHIADRLTIWQAATDAIMKQPLTGYGTGHGQKAIERIYNDHGMTQESADELNAHNQFLSTALDLGALGTLVLSVMLATPLLIGFRSHAFLSVGFILLLIVFFCAESVLLRQKGIVFVSFFYCLLFPAPFKESMDTPAQTREGI